MREVKLPMTGSGPESLLDACPVCRASLFIMVYFGIKIKGRKKDMALIIEVV